MRDRSRGRDPDTQLRSCAGDGRHRAVGQAHPAQRVVAGVGHYQVIAHGVGDGGRQQREPERLGEPGGVGGAVAQAAATADRPAHGAEVGGELDEPVVARVGDEQRPVGQPNRLPREPQRPRIVAVGGGSRGQRTAPQRVAVLLDQLVHQRREFRPVALAGHLCDDVPARVDQYQRRPRVHGVGVPGDQVGVVEHRVAHVVAAHRGGDGLGLCLVRELG